MLTIVVTALRRIRVAVFVSAAALLAAGCVPTESGETGETTTTSSSGNVILTIAMYAVVIGGLFYFLLIRPQRTRTRRQQDLVKSLAVGDEVRTIGGIFGTIEYFDEETDTAILQTEGGGRLRVARQALAGKVTRGAR